MQKGFTLIEVLVVVAIIGILASVVTPKVIGYISVADVSAANTEYHMVLNAVSAYKAEHRGVKPSDTDDLVEFFDNPLTGSYTIETSGEISGKRYPADTSLTQTAKWDTTTKEWVKP